ncbi:LysR family transcriptional regulator [Enterovibrio makurazakiensis]|uniref:LysR family transcriptional regulator n=1 Tax=Enterovibrio makurazakiensis TaxID=2910232 RepID=UPI003D1D5988
MFSYEHLASFCATVEEQSYSKAARKLKKDRTTIREQIKALEDSYAIELFCIEGKKAVVTTAGEAIYRQAKLLVKNSERLNTRLLKSYLDPITYLDIFHDSLVPISMITSVDAFLAEHFPYVKVNWLHRARDEALHNVSSGTNQVAILQYRMVNDSDYPLGYINLIHDKVNVYCGKHHTLANMEMVTAADLQLEKQYVSENLLQTMPELFNVSPDLRVVSNNDILLALLEKDGWAVISDSLAKPMIESGNLVRIQLEELTTSLTLGISFFYPESRKQTEELSALCAFLVDYAKKHFS